MIAVPLGETGACTTPEGVWTAPDGDNLTAGFFERDRPRDGTVVATPEAELLPHLWIISEVGANSEALSPESFREGTFRSLMAGKGATGKALGTGVAVLLP